MMLGLVVILACMLTLVDIEAIGSILGGCILLLLIDKQGFLMSPSESWWIPGTLSPGHSWRFPGILLDWDEPGRGISGGIGWAIIPPEFLEEFL